MLKAVSVLKELRSISESIH